MRRLCFLRFLHNRKTTTATTANPPNTPPIAPTMVAMLGPAAGEEVILSEEGRGIEVLVVEAVVIALVEVGTIESDTPGTVYLHIPRKERNQILAFPCKYTRQWQTPHRMYWISTYGSPVLFDGLGPSNAIFSVCRVFGSSFCQKITPEQSDS